MSNSDSIQQQDVEIMTKCCDVLDAIIYINLTHREDRKQHILNEIQKINPSLDRVHRIDALYVQNQGALGASMSRIKALELMIKHPEVRFSKTTSHQMQLQDFMLYYRCPTLKYCFWELDR
jgi:hypothetical protein